ncbi:DUF6612 family protein [Paenibacillus alvei]|uniref:Lipoprotein n=1 Tax=Paenibacillus alvei TaxID=44250 RepID=A0A383R4W5_PAEAL|nr:DUF6612 family protein [Paenibacillus alvei]SYX81873.1 conserved exported protein of unknown function [Paenibacillus alvei]
MKKWTAALVAIMVVLGIAACGNSTPTAGELIQKATDADKTLKSYSMDVHVEQVNGIQGDSSKEEKSDITIKTDFTKEPLGFYQDTSIVSDQTNQTIKQYFTKEGAFSQVNGEWAKVPDELKSQWETNIKSQMSLTQNLDKFKPLEKDSKITVEGNEYIMTTDVSGDKGKELAKTLLSESSGEEAAEALGKMNVKTLTMTYGVNKDTYFPTKSDFTLVLEGEENGQKISISMKVTSTITKHNEVAEIKVPKDVIDSAQ